MPGMGVAQTSEHGGAGGTAQALGASDAGGATGTPGKHG
jgi:hypothetical protein